MDDGLVDIGTKKGRSHTMTAAIREAAYAARRAKIAARLQTGGDTAVYVVRAAEGGGSQGWGWELRRFGAIVMTRSMRSYDTMDQARAAGERARIIGADQASDHHANE